MKTIKIFTAVALLAAAMSCSEDNLNDNIAPSQGSQDQFSLDVYCSFEPDAATKVAMSETTEGIDIAWKDGDTFTLQHTTTGNAGWQSAIDGEPVITFEYSGDDNKFVIAADSEGSEADLIAGYDYRVVYANASGKLSADMRQYSYTQEGNNCEYLGDLYSTNFVVSWTEATTSITFSHVMSMTKVNFTLPDASHTPKTIVWDDDILTYNHLFTGTLNNLTPNEDGSYSTYLIYPSFNVTDGSRCATVTVTCNEADAPAYEWSIFNNSSQNEAGKIYTANISLSAPFKATAAVEQADETIYLTLNEGIATEDIETLASALSVVVTGVDGITVSSVVATEDANVLSVTLSEAIYSDDVITLSYTEDSTNPIYNTDSSIAMCSWSCTVTMSTANEVLTSDISFTFEGNDENWGSSNASNFVITTDPVDSSNKVMKITCSSAGSLSVYNIIPLTFETGVTYYVSYDLYVPTGTTSSDGYLYFVTNSDGSYATGNNQYPAWTASSSTTSRDQWFTLSRSQTTNSSYGGELYAVPFFNNAWDGVVYLDNIVVEKVVTGTTRP